MVDGVAEGGDVLRQGPLVGADGSDPRAAGGEGGGHGRAASAVVDDDGVPAAHVERIEGREELARRVRRLGAKGRREAFALEHCHRLRPSTDDRGPHEALAQIAAPPERGRDGHPAREADPRGEDDDRAAPGPGHRIDCRRRLGSTSLRPRAGQGRTPARCRRCTSEASSPSIRASSSRATAAPPRVSLTGRLRGTSRVEGRRMHLPRARCTRYVAQRAAARGKLTACGPLAKSADAADLKSAARKGVPVRAWEGPPRRALAGLACASAS